MSDIELYIQRLRDDGEFAEIAMGTLVTDWEELKESRRPRTKAEIAANRIERKIGLWALAEYERTGRILDDTEYMVTPEEWDALKRTPYADPGYPGIMIYISDFGRIIIKKKP